MSFQNFQAGPHGGHLGYWNGTNLEILNLHVTQVLKVCAQSNLLFGSRRLKIFRTTTVAAILDIGMEQF